jgi:hypothetical protein
LLRGCLQSTFEVEFPADSADGFLFKVRVDGKWRRRTMRQHDPESVAASYVIDKVCGLAIGHSVLAATALERQASACLGGGANVKGLGTRVVQARVYIEVDPEIRSEAYTLMRLRARSKTELEDRQLRIAQAVALRDLLREDPTLALTHLLLEAPEKVDAQTLKGTIKTIGELVSANSPGGTWVKTAQLLERSFGGLPDDAKQAIIDRICKTLTEFGQRGVAEHIEESYKWG